MLSLFSDITWRPGIGDPNPWAWTITFGYLVAGVTCLFAGRHAEPTWPIPLRRRIWTILALLMFALSVNKQLDLQSLLTQILRLGAKRDGWYVYRQQLQVVFILVSSLIATVGIVAGWMLLKDRWQKYGLVYFGVVFLVTFIIIRAASFHHVDTFLYRLPVVGNCVNVYLEFSGILLIILGTLLAVRHRRAETRRSPCGTEG